MKRKHLIVSPEVAKIIEDKVIKRNKALPIGTRKHTEKSVTEEAIVTWAKTKPVLKSISKTTKNQSNRTGGYETTNQ